MPNKFLFKFVFTFWNSEMVIRWKFRHFLCVFQFVIPWFARVPAIVLIVSKFMLHESCNVILVFAPTNFSYLQFSSNEIVYVHL